MSKEKKKIHPTSKTPNYLLIIGIILVVFLVLLYKGKFLSVGIVPAPTPTPSPTIQPTIHIVQPGEGSISSEKYIELAKNAIAAKQKVDKEEIKTVDIQVVNWNDTSLGCPQKGIIYSQVITAGFTITLSIEGKIFKYNAGLNKIVSC